jgi:HEPN domain-containing protein
MRADTQNWVALADYDIDTAQHMLRTGRYLYVVFMCHIALEKMLKAHVVEVTQSMPTKSHDLILLVKKSGLDIPGSHLEFLGKINNASIPTRYPEDLQRALDEYPKEIVRDYLRQTKEIAEWLKQALISRTSSNDSN